jgi:tRNA (cmo5U34)-methyltransferase
VSRDAAAAAIRRAFDAGAATYDPTRRRLVPCFDAFYGAALAQLPAERDDALDVLDLGAGTGLLSALVAHAYPRARFVLVDLAPDMLAVARERFHALGREAAFLAADLARDPLPAPPGGRGFHAVVSGLAIHHLSPAEKRDLFARTHDALMPGGVFVNADQILGATLEDDRGRHAAWERAARALGSDDGEIARAKERMTLDRCDTASDQLAWLSAVGFAQASLVFEEAIFGVFAARKSAP